MREEAATMVSPLAAGCTAGSATVSSVVVRAQELAQRPNLPGRQPSHDLPALAQTGTENTGS